MLIRLFEVFLGLLFFVGILTQIVFPLLADQPILPMLRSKNPADKDRAKQALKEANSMFEEAEQRKRAAELKLNAAELNREAEKLEEKRISTLMDEDVN